MKNNKITQRNIQLYFPEHIMDIADFIPTSKIYYVSILVCIFRTRDGLANKKGLVGISKILSNVIVCIEWNNVIQFCLPFFLFILCQIRILYKFNITKEDWLCWIKQFQEQKFPISKEDWFRGELQALKNCLQHMLMKKRFLGVLKYICAIAENHILF